MSARPGFGGAIFLRNPISAINTIDISRLLQGADNSKLIIQDSFFIENSAYTGGAIYAQEINFDSLNNIFRENVAANGGAIAGEIGDPSLLIEIKGSTFLNNNVDLYRASILELRKDIFRIDPQTLIVHGHQLYETGAPAKLRLRTFNYSSENTLDLEKDVEELLAINEISLVYDSFWENTSDLIIEDMTSGGHFNQLIEVTICDAANKSLTELTNEDGK